MMETMIPPQVGMRLRTKKRGHKKREKAQRKKMREKREGTMLLSFYHTCASKQHHDLHDRESPMISLSYTSGKFFIIELGLYIPMMGFLKMPQVFVSKRVGCTPTQFLLLSFHILIALSASVAWQSLLLALTSIEGHLHSPLISRVDVRLSPFLPTPHNLHHYILFHLQCYIHVCAHVQHEG